nr:hypothetical protein [uncultured bacterium]
MKILLTTDAVGEAWHCSVELLRAINLAAEFPVFATLATFGTPLSTDQMKVIEKLPNVEVVFGDYLPEWMTEAWRDVDEAGEWLSELAKSMQPDVVHLNGYSLAIHQFGAPVIVAAHWCVWTWWRAVHKCDPPPQWNEHRQRVRNGLLAAEAVVAPSQAMLDALERAHDLHADPRWLAKPRKAIAIACAKDGYRTGPKHPFIFTAGQLWDDATNLAALDEAAGELSWRVYAAGSYHAPGQDSLVLPKHIKLTGELPRIHLQQWLADADIFAAPFKYDPFGAAILEAAMSGCALVLGDIPSLREHWNGAAEFVDPDNPREIRDTLQNLIRTPAQRRRLANAALERALAFSPLRMARAYLKLYESVSRVKHSPAAVNGSHMPRVRMHGPSHAAVRHDHQPMTAGASRRSTVR